MASNHRKSATGSRERISEAEAVVIEALWAKGALSAAQIHETVAQDRDWSLATVKTLIARLVAKGFVEAKADGRRYLYSPRIERAQYLEGESRKLLDRLFDGRAAPLFAHLAEREALSEEDLAEIEALLKELRR